MKDEFIAIIDDNEGIIFKVCNLYCRTVEDKEDLFQDIVLQLWQSYPSFRGESKLSTWMYRIALNTAITRFRSKKRKSKDIALDVIEVQHPVAYISMKDADTELMYAAIDQLSEVEKAITMLYIEGYSYKEMSEAIGISESNIGFRLNRIKSKLRTTIKTLEYGIG